MIAPGTGRKAATDAVLRARALSRWEGEGGALAPAADRPTIDEVELKLLARLGASVLDAWDTLPPGLQDSIAQRARTLGTPEDHARAKDALARFLVAYRGED
jgi:hypothetical protein